MKILRRVFEAVIAIILLAVAATSASARYYDSDRDGPCYSLKQARQKAPDIYLKYRPREEGGQCWYRPGKPWTMITKNKSQPVVVSAPTSAMAGEVAGWTDTHPVLVSLHFPSAEPASFSERFDVRPTRWFDMVTPYASQRERYEVSSLAD